MFGDLIAARLPALQAATEALMVESCTIAYPTGTEPDPLTGEDVTTYSDPVYEGKCKVQDRELQARESESASSTTDAVSKRIDIPVDAPTIAHGAVVTMGDGRVFRVLAGHRKTWQTAQRLPVEVVSTLAEEGSS